MQEIQQLYSDQNNKQINKSASNASKASWIIKDPDDSFKMVPVNDGLWEILNNENFNQFFKYSQKSSDKDSQKHEDHIQTLEENLIDTRFQKNIQNNFTEESELEIKSDEEKIHKNFTGKLSNYLIGESMNENQRQEFQNEMMNKNQDFNDQNYSNFEFKSDSSSNQDNHYYNYQDRVDDFDQQQNLIKIQKLNSLRFRMESQNLQKINELQEEYEQFTYQTQNSQNINSNRLKKQSQNSMAVKSFYSPQIECKQFGTSDENLLQITNQKYLDLASGSNLQQSEPEYILTNEEDFQIANMLYITSVEQKDNEQQSNDSQINIDNNFNLKEFQERLNMFKKQDHVQYIYEVNEEVQPTLFDNIEINQQLSTSQFENRKFPAQMDFSNKRSQKYLWASPSKEQCSFFETFVPMKKVDKIQTKKNRQNSMFCGGSFSFMKI